VPLSFHHPRSLTGRRIFEDEVGLADVAPTLYEWMSVESDALLEGRSLLSRTDRGRSLEPRPVIAELPGGLVSVRIGTWRMILNQAELKREGAYGLSSVELYDTAYDPSELEDVSEGHPEVLEELKRALAEWEGLFPPLEGVAAF
jgi:arylsulfatase A-like enzyme